MLRAKRLDPETATLAERRAAWAAIDAFNDCVTESAMALSAERGLERGGEVIAPVAPNASEALPTGPSGESTGANVRSGEKEAPPHLAVLAGSAAQWRPFRPRHPRLPLLPRVPDPAGSRWDGILAVQDGRSEVLAPALQERADQLAVAREYLEVLGLETGAPELARTAAGLGTTEAELASRVSSHGRSSQRDRSRGLDDDLEL